MPKAGKKYTKAVADRENKIYRLDEAVPLLKKIAYAKFNETVEISMKFDFDPKHAIRWCAVRRFSNDLKKQGVVIGEKGSPDAGADEVGEEIVEDCMGWIDLMP
jgi:large subunit ribosomal protein L1